MFNSWSRKYSQPARCSGPMRVVPLRDANADEHGAVHEGAVAALLDTAGAMASWSVTGVDLLR